MSLKIETDYQRFKAIVKGKIKKDLKKFITKAELLGKKGKDIVSIPIPQIEIPKFKFGPKQTGGIGQGEGEVGTPLGRSDEQGDSSKAGNAPAEHILEVDITLEELAKILGEELQLPKIEHKGKNLLKTEKERYTGIHRSGPDSLKHFKRTFKEALKRQIITGSYNYKDPIIVPIKSDKRFKSWRLNQIPESSAVIIYMMDVSGSMGDEQKEIVRIESFWIDTYLRSQYKGLETRYIIHDAVAREVDKETFYHTKESGGTIISSAYKLALEMIEKRYNPAEWNIYVFHFSDGDNWSADDTAYCVELLKEKIINYVNLFCYGQVESQYGSGQFIKDLNENLTDEDKVITSRIEDKDAIINSIKDFLGTGR
jgi:sporulation protein YhbH